MLLGFDIGGTKSAVTIGRKLNNGAIDITGKTMLATDKPVYEMIETLFVAAEKLLHGQHANKDQLSGIGISCGGPLSSKRGIILSPPNLPGWDNIPIVELAQNRFGKKAFLQNDANACAVAEWKYGAGRGFSNVIFLTFGTGMGSGLILDGKLYSGTTDLAGEVGHLRLAETGPVGFGKAGSFEGFCSGGGIAQIAQNKARQEIQMGRTVSFCNSLDDLPAITAKAVAEAAYKGDAVAIEVYKTCAFYLGRGLALLIDILNPEVIILGSIYGRSTDLIKPYMQEVLNAEAIGDSLQSCKIVPAGLGEQTGDYAALSLADIISV
ncbi:MAG: ROK family protein [Agriterribacter sp.]